jgi:glycosyltransferase involved in cell wall biosynthesis
VSIAAVVITKNEERNIEACLRSVHWVDEAIVVDACSEDRTVDIAKRHTDTVFIRPWPGYGPQKNYGLDQATADWILILDADERVSDALREEILGTIRRPSPTPAGFEIPRRNFFYGRWIRRGGMYPDYQLRLFKRNAGRYDDVLLHEHLRLDGDVSRLVSPLDHFSMPTVGDHVRKSMRYTTLGALEKLKTRTRVSALDLAGSHVATILRTLLLRRGYQDGVHGLVVALFAGMHTFVKYAKAWDMLRQQGGKVQ